jgi:hypothetical protein
MTVPHRTAINRGVPAWNEDVVRCELSERCVERGRVERAEAFRRHVRAAVTPQRDARITLEQGLIPLKRGVEATAL